MIVKVSLHFFLYETHRCCVFALIVIIISVRDTKRDGQADVLNEPFRDERTQLVPRSKHYPLRLQKPIC